MFPLKAKYTIGYRFREPTTYSKHHLGLDCICPKNTAVYAPFDGKVTTVIGKEGGNTVWFYWSDLIMRVMHLNSFGKTGEVSEGDIIGYVGSTGSLSTGNHAHIDISKNKVDINNIDNFIDPEKFIWEKEDFMKYQLFGNKPDGKVYFLTNLETRDNVLIPVKNEKDLRDNFGLDPIIDWKDDVWVAGVPVDTMIDSKCDYEDVVDELTDENKKLKEQVELDKKTWDKHKCEVKKLSKWEAFKILIGR